MPTTPPAGATASDVPQITPEPSRPSEGLQWPAQPVAYEVNTAVWLREIARRAGTAVTLGDVPPVEWDAVVPNGVNVVWLMGVWERSLVGRAIALDNPGLRAAWSSALPDWSPADVAGSPYCIRDYAPDPAVGGWAGIDAAREQLRARGACLMLDWVPNHVGPDSPWLADEPDAFVRGTAEELAGNPTLSFRSAARCSPAVRTRTSRPGPTSCRSMHSHTGLRKVAGQALARIAEHADAVRCDMAMLMLDDVVTATWGERVGATAGDDVLAGAHRGGEGREPPVHLRRRGLLGPGMGPAAAGLRPLL